MEFQRFMAVTVPKPSCLGVIVSILQAGAPGLLILLPVWLIIGHPSGFLGNTFLGWNSIVCFFSNLLISMTKRKK